ncbi:hypothetical protein DFJ74DRAFT_135628 [Hyaloraphidium curvatum]|nr:hypothetical protein DFJ74DRAFT_135628 [Hyaloraphidium curvatum]
MGRWNLTAGAVGKGDLWYFDVAKDWDVRPLEPEGFDLQGNDFHPLGIAFSARKGTPMYFYAINHRRAGGTVEIFSLRFREDDLDYTVPSIKWIRTVKHPLVNTPNSLLPVEQSNGKLHYYVTNDHYFHAIDGIYAKLKFAENALRLPLASVALCSVDPIPVASPTEGVECRIVAPNLRFANGIGMSNDGRTVFVAQTLGFSLSSYDRDPHTNSLTFKGSTPLGYAVDNVEVDEGDGSVIVAGHPDPVLVKWVAGGVGDPEERDAYRAGFRAPSRVVRVVPSAEAAPKDWKVSTLFEDSGEYFGSSSTGVMDSVRNLFLASGLYDIGVLVCRKAA